MKKGSRFLLRVLLCLILAAGLVAVLFWESLAVYLTPKTVLRKAILDTWSQLEDRFQEHPVLHILGAMDGKQDIQLLLESENSTLGSVRYDFSVQTAPTCLAAEGTAAAAGRELALKGYLDKEMLALASEELTGGRYYGVTFDTFSSDIRKIPLLSWIISDDLINRWDAALSELGSTMAQFPPRVPEVPHIQKQEMEQLTLGLMALPVKVSNTDVSLNGETVPCQRITFRAEGRAVGQYLSQMQLDVGEEAAFTAAFYLLDGSLILTDIRAEGTTANARLQLETRKDPLTLTWEITTGNEVKRLQTQVTSKEQGNILSENWHISGIETEQFTYSLDRQTGAFSLTVGNGEPIKGTFAKKDDGFRMETADIGPVWELVFGKADEADYAGHLAVTVSEGEKQVQKPEMKNLDTWSMEDFLTLMEGVGSLIGLKLQ